MRIETAVRNKKAPSLWLAAEVCFKTYRRVLPRPIKRKADREDGLGTHIHYPQGLTRVQSDFDQQEIFSQARSFSQERFRSEWRDFFARKGIRVPMG